MRALTLEHLCEPARVQARAQREKVRTWGVGTGTTTQQTLQRQPVGPLPVSPLYPHPALLETRALAGLPSLGRPAIARRQRAGVPGPCVVTGA